MNTRGREMNTQGHNKLVVWGARKRMRLMQGRRRVATPVRERLFEWFLSLRFSIDWRRYNATCRSRGLHKCIGRFPRSLLKAKLSQFLAEYIQEQLILGHTPTPFQLTPKWFSSWEHEHGLNMKQPTRKYKVPERVLEERCEIFWLNVFRVRAACEALHGYDPEMENFDQSPYYTLSLIHI